MQWLPYLPSALLITSLLLLYPAPSFMTFYRLILFYTILATLARSDYKKTISVVSNALTSMLKVDEIVKQVVDTVRTEMFVDASGVIVLEPETQTCQTFFLTDDAPSEHDSAPVAVGFDDPLVQLIQEQKTLITKFDLEEDPYYDAVKDICLEAFARLRASLAIPLIYHGRVAGVLAVGQKKSGHFFAREDVELLGTMANQAAVAIQNATEHQKVVRYAEELEASLRRIQILESIKTNLSKFVPKTVQELIEESPQAPVFDKHELDVSVVFADMTGYTRLSAEMDLDQLNRLVERYFGAFLDEIMKYGGDVNETAGDGLMVIFKAGDPRDHALAAVRAALGIQRRTVEINAAMADRLEPITMKVGVNSGLASVGATKIEGAAGTRWTYTASGPDHQHRGATRRARTGRGRGHQRGHTIPYRPRVQGRRPRRAIVEERAASRPRLPAVPPRP